ncbi:antigen 5 like allergen Cul n 1-like [Ochlerotatus camptorhynchus]|uniref:antigen 5 like allergen Cul n 1-like n=1 Tax=Ochlerotatus camptorhynchus TaxID=644619 RepID=UPI0031E09F0B
MRPSMKSTIINEHNLLRSSVASGKLDGFSSASRMSSLAWNDELQSVATSNARRCQFEHDACRNTRVFRFSGQNLAMRSLQGRRIRVRLRKLLREFVQVWFDEHQHANQSMIDAYPEDHSGPDVGHFTQMVSDRTWAVGCGMTRFTDREATHYYLVCNYSFANIVHQPVYVKGKPCSRCQRKCSRKYPGLCGDGEKISSTP